MTQRKFIWKRFDDPVAPLVKGGRRARGYEPGEDWHDPDYHEAMRSFGVDVFKKPDNSGKFGPCILGPYGPVPFSESNVPSTLFNLWVGHASFEIDRATQAAIERVPGVEALDVYTRYRLRVAVGVAFDEGEVLGAIDRAVQPEDRRPPLEAVLSAKYPYWACAKTADGKTVYHGSRTRDEALAKARASGSVVKTSWKD